MPDDDPLVRLRHEIEEEKGDVTPDQAADDLAAKAFSFLRAEDLHPTASEVFAAAQEEVQMSSGEEERARARVERAMRWLRERQHRNAGEVLHDARQAAGIAPKEAAAMLGLSVAAVQRLESGRGIGGLINQPAERVGAYVRRLRVDPRSFLAALFPPGHAGPVYGYTPRVAADERGRLLERAAADSAARDRRWALDFLTSAEEKR